ncbi:MAG: beta-lactamase family protein [Acidobacteriia bacterium]|nr:beta-lactamase family protein [Terriglobia bacterium]
MAQRTRDLEHRNSAQLRGQLAQVAAKYKIPGIVAAAIQNGRVSSVEAFGERDVATHSPMTENTVFEAGTLSEPVYAYAVLELAAEGRLDLGAPVTQYFPLPYMRNPDPFSAAQPGMQMDQVTDVRFEQMTGIRILNHTSGLPNWAPNDHLRLVNSPGQKWSRSGEGEVFLQRAVEHMTGLPFDELASRTVLGPYGMVHSGYTWRDGFAADKATGYDAGGNAVPAHHYSQAVGPMTLYTTAADYARFVAIVLASSVRQRLHEGVVSLMLNPTTSVDDAFSFSWGMGWGLEQTAKGPYFFNWSAQPGFYCFVMASRKNGDGVVIFTNSENGLPAAREIVQTVLGGDHPVLKSPILSPR